MEIQRIKWLAKYTYRHLIKSRFQASLMDASPCDIDIDTNPSVIDHPPASMKFKNGRAYVITPTFPFTQKYLRMVYSVPTSYEEITDLVDAIWYDAKILQEYDLEDLSFTYEGTPSFPPLPEETPEERHYRNAVSTILDRMEADFDLSRLQTYALFSRLFPDSVLPEAGNGSLVQEAMRQAREFMVSADAEKIRSVAPPASPTTPTGGSFRVENRDEGKGFRFEHRDGALHVFTDDTDD